MDGVFLNFPFHISSALDANRTSPPPRAATYILDGTIINQESDFLSLYPPPLRGESVFYMVVCSGLIVSHTPEIMTSLRAPTASLEIAVAI